MVWLLIALPTVAVIESFIFLGFAIVSDDGMVEDDYYRRGKEINRVLARDQAAAALGLEGVIALSPAQHALEVRLTARKGMLWPEQVELKFLYATRSGLDRSLVLPRHADGTYRAPLPDLAPGHWNVQLAAQGWRLTGSLHVPGVQQLTLRPSGS
jgi:hypothetical protein